MIIEGIKNLLGEDLTKQVETALKGKGKDGKDVDLVIGNDGSFVPAEKYNGANSGKTSAENALISKSITLSTSETPDTADSPTLAIMMESAIPTKTASICSITRGNIKANNA